MLEHGASRRADHGPGVCGKGAAADRTLSAACSEGPGADGARVLTGVGDVATALRVPASSAPGRCRPAGEIGPAPPPPVKAQGGPWNRKTSNVTSCSGVL